MLNNLKKFINHLSLLFISLGHRGCFHWMDDEIYLKIAYRIKTGKKLNLNPPVIFISWALLSLLNNIYLVTRYMYLCI